MSKDSKFTIKNTQIAGAINLTGLKAKLSKKSASEEGEKDEVKSASSKDAADKRDDVVSKSESAGSKKAKTTKPKKEEAAPVESKEKEELISKKPPVEIKASEVVAAKAPEIVVREVEKKEPERQVAEKQTADKDSLPQPSRAPEPPKTTEQHSSQPPRTQYPPRTDGGQYQDRRPPYPERRPYAGDRPAYSGDRPQGSRPPYAGDRPAYSGDRPQGSRPPYAGDRPAYSGDRPQGSRPPYAGDRPAYSGDRPQGSRPPYSGDRPAYNRPFQPGQRFAGGPQSRPPYGDRGQGFAQKPFSSLPGSSSQQRPPYPPRPQGFRPSPGAGQSGYSGSSQKPPSKEMPAKERPSKFEEKKPADAFKQARGKGKEVRKDEKGYDSRVRHGLVSVDDGEIWRKKRHSKQFHHYEQPEIIRPTKIKVRLPITIKELAVEMKLKASELIAKLFLQGLIVTLNDVLDDELAIQLLGHDFGCEITIDTSEKERIQITGKTIRDEIGQDDQLLLLPRPPVVAFMGHVDHGKTSLIDAIRKSNRASKEVGAITQHIGAFQCVTSHGPITILDTPGHEAFTLMRERGAEITDIVVLVIAGDEGIQEQTLEALNQARSAKATIVVALTKCDKPNFNADNVMRQMADRELLPEAWGGQTVTISCSAVSGQGIPELLEMLALQSEVLELKANPQIRARGTVIESQVIQGLGDCATVLVQNGTLREGDALVFAAAWAKIKRMRDDSGKAVTLATPSTPVSINGLSSLPEAGDEFIVVKSEKEAKEIAETRQEGKRQSSFLLKKRSSVENLMQTASNQKKILRVVVRADVQGSLEALKKALERIKSTKAEIDFISQSVGQISESDVQLAGASKSIILGFHTNIESHAEPLIKDLKVDVRLHDIIYHAVDDIKALMKALLDKIAQEQEKGKAEVKALFKSSHLGMIAGCIVVDGSIARNCQVRIRRDGQIIWQGAIQSLRRGKDDVKEVQKGIECGIFLQGFNQLKEGDVLEAFEVTYLEQEL